MSEAAEVRKRLEATTFPDLGTMMEGYARAAVDLAKAEFAQRLDYSTDSADALDDILVQVAENPNADLEYEVRLWGSYLGEVIRRRYAGTWEMTDYPGDVPTEDGKKKPGPMLVPTVEVRGSRLFPLIKIYRRLTLGDEDDLRSFLTMVIERLGKPARVN
jgi:hypothetical protein